MERQILGNVRIGFNTQRVSSSINLLGPGDEDRCRINVPAILLDSGGHSLDVKLQFTG